MNADPATVTFLVQNTGVKAITAWHVTIAVGDESKAFGVDAYRSFAGVADEQMHIMPGAVRSVTTNAPAALAASSSIAVITPTCAIFEDRSFAGDSKFADYVFRRRAAERAGLRQLNLELCQAKAAGPVSLTTLETLLSTMDVTVRSDGGDPHRQSVHANLAYGIARSRSGKSSAVLVLNGLLDDAKRDLAAVEAHARP
jgi:hypothetical protein